MKIKFRCVKELSDGISLLAPELDIVICDDADITVTAKKSEGNVLSVSYANNKATITYGGGKARFFRGLAYLVDAIKRGEEKYTLSEFPIFKTNGAMVDMSRNVVMNVKTVKLMLQKMALMGQNMFMLYTEDTYEIEGRPYFGHMRGRYTKAEMKELDAYAQKLGIEMIPCIQVLGHLATHLHWGAAAPYRDTKNVMLVGAEETYRLIADMFKTVKECFTTRRVHVGMDETNDIGRGKYLEIHGLRNQDDIYFEHMARVIEMARAEGLEPMMWSDMFFRLAGKDLEDYTDYDVRVSFSDEVKAKVPKGIQQVFWDYYRDNEEFYAINIDKHHDVFGKDTLFAGGIWLWSGHGPLFSRSLRFTIPALDACKHKGVSEIIATIWVNGGESDLILSLAGLCWYADYDYKGGFSLESAKECFRITCGANYDDIMKTELCQHPDGSDVSLCRAMLYNDPLIGLIDAHIDELDTVAYYKDASEKMADHGDLGIFAEAYEVTQKLTSLLENKANFGVRLKSAYDSGNRDALVPFIDECDVMIAKMKDFREAHMKAWMLHNKPLGWEANDMHYGATLARFETTKARISAYIKGEINTIEELEEERLYRFGGKGFNGNFVWYLYSSYTTVNRQD